MESGQSQDVQNETNSKSGHLVFLIFRKTPQEKPDSVVFAETFSLLIRKCLHFCIFQSLFLVFLSQTPSKDQLNMQQMMGELKEKQVKKAKPEQTTQVICGNQVVDIYTYYNNGIQIGRRALNMS